MFWAEAFEYILPKLLPQIARELNQTYGTGAANATSLLTLRAATDICNVATQYCTSDNLQYQSWVHVLCDNKYSHISILQAWSVYGLSHSVSTIWQCVARSPRRMFLLSILFISINMIHFRLRLYGVATLVLNFAVIHSMSACWFTYVGKNVVRFRPDVHCPSIGPSGGDMCS